MAAKQVTVYPYGIHPDWADLCHVYSERVLSILRETKSSPEMKGISYWDRISRACHRIEMNMSVERVHLEQKFHDHRKKKIVPQRFPRKCAQKKSAGRKPLTAEHKKVVLRLVKMFKAKPVDLTVSYLASADQQQKTIDQPAADETKKILKSQREVKN